VTDAWCRVRVCRDCCCGTARKHPGVDHDGLVTRLRDRVGIRAEIDVTTCLLACELSNVVVVSPSPAGRGAGARPVWLREVLDGTTVDAIAAWVSGGGPGVAPMPAVLAAHRSQVAENVDRALAGDVLPTAVPE
jgi:(2Fe-2S) ferredoxin